MTETEILARIIEGEASVCGLLGMLAVAHIYGSGRNTTFYGNADPSPLAEFVAQFWWLMPDVTDGATFLFSRQDLRLSAVQEITDNKDPTLVVDCSGGLALYAFR